MAASDDRRLDDLVSAVADGRRVDWEDLLARAAEPLEQGLIAQLQVLAAIEQGGKTAARTVPRTWGPLEVFEEIGHGAYGRVYRARDTRLDREVALKLLDGQAVTEDRFLREGKILARISHPHIVAVHGADVFDGVAGIWMELIRGRSLETIVRQQGPFGAREAALIGMDLCAALSAVHGAGLRHRDIKAHNVMREIGGRIVLMDFGAGRPSDAAGDVPDASVAGTPMYMAPELFGAAPASVATDLYALGVLLFFIATGEYPVAGTSIAELRDAHARASRRRLREARPDTPALLSQVVDRALNIAPDGRFLTAADMEQSLAATLQVAHEHVGQPQASRARGWRAQLARPLPTWAVMALLILGLPAAFLIGRIRPASGSENSGSSSPAASLNQTMRLTKDQWDTVESQQEIARVLAERGSWSQAAAHYDRVQQLLRPAIGIDEPFRAHVLAKLGWAQLQAGQAKAARDNLALALYKLEQEGGSDYPLRAAITMAVAEDLHVSGDLAGAAAAVVDAIRIQQSALAAACSMGAGRQLDVQQITKALAYGPPSTDQDNDWIPDAIERAVGLDPARSDSDGDGLSDDEEDTDGDGIRNGLAWAIVSDPARVLTHFGNVDPERAGYQREMDFTGRPAPQSQAHRRAWRLTADRQGHYYQRLTSADKERAMTRGWRLLSCGSLWSGVSGVDLDLTPLGARYDQNFLIGPNGRLSLLLATSVMPRVGEYLELGPAGPWPAAEYVFEPGRGARVTVASFRRNGYGGHPQFQEDFGLFLSATNDIGAAPRGEVDLSLVLLQIR